MKHLILFITDIQHRVKNNKTPFKKKSVYKETYKRGQFETDREKICKWVLNHDVWIEVINAGINEDDTEYVTFTFNNIPRKQ